MTDLLSRVTIAAACLALVSTLAYSAESRTPTFTKLRQADVTFKKKNGYWVECTYSGLGQVCNYVYARTKSAAGARLKFEPVRADDKELKRKNGYWVECYYSGTGQVCTYVYARVKKPKP